MRTLYRWQAEAFEEWKRSRHDTVVGYDTQTVWNHDTGVFDTTNTPRLKRVQGGTVAVVTGGGKTMVGFMAIFDWLRGGSQRQVVIAVPTTRLLHQWRDELMEHGVNRPRCWGAGFGRGGTNGLPVVIGVVNSLRKWVTDENDTTERLLVVDECHRLGSDENAKIPVLIPHDAVLGLSATPKRTDGKDVTALTGPIVYQLDYREALKDGIIPSFTLRAVECPLTFGELLDYQDYSKRIAIVHTELSQWFGSGANFFGIPESSHDKLSVFKALCAKRKRVVNSSRHRMTLLNHLLAKHAGDKVLLFHESVDDLNGLFLKYHEAYDPAIYHYQREDNEEQFDRWLRGDTNLLLSCRALNEGVNAPECDVAIMLSGPNGVRARIQTLGRALRGENALIYLAYTPNTTDTKGLGQLVGKGGVPKHLVKHFAWQNEELKGVAVPFWFSAAPVPQPVTRLPLPPEHYIFPREQGVIVLPTLTQALGVLPTTVVATQTLTLRLPTPTDTGESD